MSTSPPSSSVRSRAKPLPFTFSAGARYQVDTSASGSPLAIATTSSQVGMGDMLTYGDRGVMDEPEPELGDGVRGRSAHAWGTQRWRLRDQHRARHRAR